MKNTKICMQNIFDAFSVNLLDLNYIRKQIAIERINFYIE